MGTVQVREESEKESEKRCDLRRQQKTERDGGTSDVRWKSVPQMNGCNRKRSVADSGQTSTLNVKRDVDEAEHSRHLASMSTGRRS